MVSADPRSKEPGIYLVETTLESSSAGGEEIGYLRPDSRAGSDSACLPGLT